METDHFLVFTQTYEEEGTYIVASSSLRDHPDYIRRMLLEAFHVTELLEDDGRKIVDIYDLQTEFPDEAGYLLILSPRSRFLWNGLVLMLEIPKIDLGLKDDRVRLIADGGQHRLALAKQEFAEGFLTVDEDSEVEIKAPICVIEQQAHLPVVNREMRKINRAINRLAESILESVHRVRHTLRDTSKHQDLLESWYLFASEHGHLMGLIHLRRLRSKRTEDLQVGRQCAGVYSSSYT